MTRRSFEKGRTVVGSEAVASYLRVSTLRQFDGEVSIPSQRNAIARHFNATKLPIACEFVDAGTGTDDNRPDFQRMIEEALGPAPRFNTIAVHALSRFFRSGPEAELLMRKLAKHGIRVVSVTQPIGDDSTSQMLRQVIQVFDEHTSRENGKNVRRAMRENAEQGFWNGTTPPLGYRTFVAEVRGQKNKKRIEKDPVEADLVTTIYDLYLNGVPKRPDLGVKEVVKILNGRGLRTRRGALFGVGPVHKILTSDYYVSGRYPYSTTVGQPGDANEPKSITYIPIPPVVSRDVFDAVQAKLKQRNPRETPPRVSNGPSLLAGMLVHATCGAGMTRTGTVRRGRRYSYYSCAANHQKGATACSGRHVPADMLDGLVLGALKTRLLAPERLRSVLEGLIQRQAMRGTEVSSRIEALRREAETAGERLARLYALVEDGTTKIDDVLRDRIRVLQGEKTKATAALERAMSQTALATDIDDEKIERFGQILNARLDEADVNARRGYIASIVERIEVDDGTVRVVGHKQVLADAVQRGDGKVRGFVRRWRTRQDSNLRPLPSEGSALSS